MSTESRQIRPQRIHGTTPLTVAVTGGASGAGHALVQRLTAGEPSGDGTRVVAIDHRRGDLTGVAWRAADVCDPRLAECLSDVDVLVHAAEDRSPETPTRERRTRNIRAAQTVLTAAAARRVPRVILLSSTMVYGTGHGEPLPESAPVTVERGPGLAADFAEIEELARLARRSHPGLSVTVVRPAPLVGVAEDTLLARHFQAPRLLRPKGSAHAWQFCHVDDLASALEFLVRHDVADGDGAIAVGCDGSLSYGEIMEITGARGLELPPAPTASAIQRLRRNGITSAPASELASLLSPRVVDCAKLREAGWRPAYDNVAALRVLLDTAGGTSPTAGRAIGRKEVTVTAASAAGAAIAAFGTAAAVRHLRRRRKSS